MGVDGVLDFKIAFAVYAPEIYNEEKTIKKSVMILIDFGI